MRKICVGLLLATMFTSSALAGADPVKVGDNIRFYNRPGTQGGGEFGVRNVSQNVGTEANPAWITFCVQRSERLDFASAGFDVKAISDKIVLGNKLLSNEAAYLYTAFRSGTLDASQGAYSGDDSSADDLQLAIWKWQGEWNPALTGRAKFWYDQADNANPSSIGNVRVLNLTWGSTRGGFEEGQDAQDVLVLVPSPAAALLGLLGVAGLVTLRRSF